VWMSQVRVGRRIKNESKTIAVDQFLMESSVGKTCAVDWLLPEHFRLNKRLVRCAQSIILSCAKMQQIIGVATLVVRCVYWAIKYQKSTISLKYIDSNIGTVERLITLAGRRCV